MSSKLYLFLVTCTVVTNVVSADIFGDLFKWDLMSVLSDEDDKDEISKREEEDTSIQNTCDCHGMKCDCCVDFNISSVIDLGGPGCVNMKYLSKEEGVLLNVSYGDSVLHSHTVTNKSKKGTCIPMLSYFAEICARFSDLKEEGDGMVGCLNFEPTFLGEVTGQYPVGCFRMNPNAMVLDNSILTSKENEDDEKSEESTTEKPDEEDSFIEAAQESLEFFSSLLGIDLSGKKQTKNSTSTPTEASSTEKSSRKNKKRVDISKNLV